MTIGNELVKVLKEFSIKVDNKDVLIEFEYGDQSALEKFIEFKTKKGLKRLPLIFYVTNKVKDRKGMLSSETDLVILSKANKDNLSQVRYPESYEKFIIPIYKSLIKQIDRSNSLYLRKKNRDIEYIDKANYGFTEKGGITNDKSVITEYVDARIIKINIELNKNC